jgi:hypothetical protein
MTALISEHNIAKYFGGLRFTDNGLTDKDMANTIRKQFGAAMAGTNGLHTASQGWSGTVCSGIQLDGFHRHSTNLAGAVRGKVGSVEVVVVRGGAPTRQFRCTPVLTAQVLIVTWVHCR